jgi:hypothetical protein
MEIMPREIDNIERFDKQAQETKRRAIDDRLRASNDYPESRAVFSDWNRDLRNEGAAPIDRSGTVTMPGHPEIELSRKGDLFGPYARVHEFLKERGATERRGQEMVGMEAHHLIEDRLLRPFGFSRGEAPAVAIYAHEHAELVHGGDERVEWELPKGVVYDIDDIVDVHVKSYAAIGRPEWGEQVKQFVASNEARILDAYRDGTVPGVTASDISRIERFFHSL